MFKMKFDREKPYNNLPLLTPKMYIETQKILRKAITAGRALAELKGLSESIPNQAMLINTIVLQEAQASSEIENIITTSDALFQALSIDQDKIDPATKEVLRYREALWNGYQVLLKRPVLSTNIYIDIVQSTTAKRFTIRKTPGTTISNTTTGEVLYTPPDGEAVIRDKLKNLDDYIHTSDVDALIQLAVIHYQFEAIHPFPDGNGRTGRILNILFLMYKELLDLPILYLSKYIIDHKNDYYQLLRGVTEEKAWEPWILFMLNAVEQTSLYTREKVIKIRELLVETIEHAKGKLPKRVYSKELIELLFHQPYTKVKFLVDNDIAKRQTAAEYLKELESIGILKGHKLGKENLFLNVKLFDLLSK
jgi:Fic family protein